MKSLLTLLLAFVISSMPLLANAQSEVLSYYPQVDGVQAASADFFISSTGELGEPNYMLPFLYEFESTEAAIAAMPAICEHMHNRLVQEEAEYGVDANPVIETSVGEQGDDRCAYVTESYSPNLHTAVLVDSNILVIAIGGVGGEMEPFTETFLTDFLAETGEEPLRIPAVDDLPDGWVDDDEEGPSDILHEVYPEGTPTADIG